MQFGCLEQLIRIDIYGGDDVFGQRQFVERLAHEPAQPHDCFATQQDVKPKLALQLFQRRRGGIAEYEFGAKGYFQAPDQSFGR